MSYWRKPMFVALGGADTARCEACCREAGIDLLLVKPVDPSMLTGFLGRLRSVVEDYESFDPAI